MLRAIVLKRPIMGKVAGERRKYLAKTCRWPWRLYIKPVDAGKIPGPVA